MASSDDSSPGTVWTFLVPGDPAQRTGGYGYVREIVTGLEQLGQAVRLQGLAGRFPEPDAAALCATDEALAALPDGSVVVLDGLAMSGQPTTLAKHRRRLHLVALVHHPLADEAGLSEQQQERLFRAESDALAQVSGVMTTSATTARRLADFHVPSAAIHVVPPGVHKPARVPVREARMSAPVRILCVATLSERKAQHQLLEALAELPRHQWQCVLAGSDQRQPEYAGRLKAQIARLGLEDRVRLSGELEEDALAEVWQWADVMVLPSLYEGYGMVVGEALCQGLPVITTDGGALAETGRRPGVRQYPAGDVAKLREHLEVFLADPFMREQLGEEARASAADLTDWQKAAKSFRAAVRGVLAQCPSRASQFDGDWLSLREPADHAARDAGLAEEAAAWLRRHRPESSPQVVDVGCGSGSNVRYLAGVLPANVQWLLVDQDAALLARARHSLPGLHGDERVDFRQCRLSADTLAQRLPPAPALVTASALLDLVTTPWLAALADYVAGANAALLVVLTYAGDFGLSPADSDEAWVRDQINAHQQGDKGEGEALGPAAAEALATLLRDKGYQVRLATSPWQLSPESQDLQSALLAGWHEAALEQAPADQARVQAWARRRQALIDQGDSSITVHHLDLLALPPAVAPQ